MLPQADSLSKYTAWILSPVRHEMQTRAKWGNHTKPVIIGQNRNPPELNNRRKT